MLKFKYILPAALAIASVSCNKSTFNINTSPNDPLAVPVSKLLPVIESNLGAALAIGGIGNVTEVYVHRMTTREEQDQYGATGNNFYIRNTWNTLYTSVLSNNEVIIRDATSAGNLRYSGIAKIIKAYAFSQMVDIWGDLPFSEALQLRTPIQSPKFDKGSDIYPACIALLDAGIADLNNAGALNLLKPGTDDVIYGGDVTKWTKAANTIKLKLYIQQRLIKTVTTEVNALVTAGNLIGATTESFLAPFGPNGATDDRYPGFSEYFATQRGNDVSPWFYETMKGINAFMPGTGNFGNPDPRVPFYWYNMLTAAQAPKEGNQTEYRDKQFASIYFGSTGPDRDRNQQNTLSIFGIFPVGGRYDDGGALSVTANSGTGAAPQRFITYADRLFMEAELINVGIVTGGTAAARAKLLAAMTEAFKQVDYVITTYIKPQTATQAQTTVPVIAGSAASTTYMNNVLTAFDAGSAAKQLEIIMTQKWISSFGASVDAYTDKRRTGFPVVFDPSNTTMAPGGRVQPPLAGDPQQPAGQKSVPVIITRPYSVSLSWPASELNTNKNAPTQKQPGTYKPFWLP